LSETSPPARFLLIDGLRGVAATMVMLYHFHFALRDEFARWLPEVVGDAFGLGWSGVEVFFVLSGFVIAFSIGERRITPGYVGRFALRRSLRLDPPYWGSLALAIGLAWLGNRLFPDVARPLPDVGVVLAHLVYLQGLLGLGQIVDVYWSLCLEIQFYLLLVTGLAVVQLLSRAPAVRMARTVAFYVVFGALAVWSVLIGLGWWEAPVTGLFTSRWYLFFLGAMTWWAQAGTVSVALYRATWLALAVAQAAAGWHVPTCVGLAASALIHVAHQRGFLTTGLGGRGWQYLGRISYSLYLVHPIVGWRAISVGKRWLGPDPSPAACTGLFLGGILVSLLASEVFYRLLERPAIGLSRRVRLPRAPAPVR
jgi:peptidoglycan/LPS O-acetylase OafA/YrhL